MELALDHIRRSGTGSSYAKKNYEVVNFTTQSGAQILHEEGKENRKRYLPPAKSSHDDIMEGMDWLQPGGTVGYDGSGKIVD